MSSMTLEQVRDWIRNCAVSCTESSDISNEFLGEMADAIDAHLAGRGEAVAWTCGITWKEYQSETTLKLTRRSQPMYDFTIPLYTAPPIDLAAVREVISKLHADGDEHGCAAKLEAAIKGVA